MPELRTETMTVNMGPQHPSTHGVLRLILELAGETVVGTDVTIALTGRDGGAAGGAAEIHVNVPEESTPRIQEVHTTLIHAMCELIED